MQTSLPNDFLATAQGQEADAILRKCVHCGFCNATCPTYQLLGDELDGPRGRIYLIKGMLEGNAVTASTQMHLDRCLTCRACETTCPSGVSYGRLVDIGRSHVEARIARTPLSRLQRWLLRQVLSRREWVGPMMQVAQTLRPLLPMRLKKMIPRSFAAANVASVESDGAQRRMLMLQGCVQPALAPSINIAARRVLAKLGIEALEIASAGCCGALSQHLAADNEALRAARRNINAWWPHVEAGAEAIIVTASGCGTMVKEYGHLLGGDANYAAKAERVSALARDLVEVFDGEDLSKLQMEATETIAFHSPCSLQHGQRLGGRVEKLLTALGYRLTEVKDSHLCCGSAGSYSILQSDIAAQLRAHKLENLQAGAPTMIATANIGCLHFLQEEAAVPVRHWIELIAG